MNGESQEFDDDPLIGSIRALKAEVNRWIDAEVRTRLDPLSPRVVPTTTDATIGTDDSRDRLDALAARLEGRLKQGPPSLNTTTVNR